MKISSRTESSMLSHTHILLISTIIFVVWLQCVVQEFSDEKEYEDIE
jgi:hypothetical protein